VSDGILPLGDSVGIHSSTAPKMPIHLQNNANDARYAETYDEKIIIIYLSISHKNRPIGKMP
ncbi:TPA: hypothetical protein ACKJ72_002110, partial [Neisseria gonorrhoeae]